MHFFTFFFFSFFFIYLLLALELRVALHYSSLSSITPIEFSSLPPPFPSPPSLSLLHFYHLSIPLCSPSIFPPSPYPFPILQPFFFFHFSFTSFSLPAFPLLPSLSPSFLLHLSVSHILLSAMTFPFAFPLAPHLLLLLLLLLPLFFISSRSFFLLSVFWVHVLVLLLPSH